MVGSAEILAAFRELSNSKQLDRSELHGLLQDGIHPTDAGYQLMASTWYAALGGLLQ